MLRLRAIIILLTSVGVLCIASPGYANSAIEAQILSVIQKMEATFNAVEDYMCDVEVIYYRDGMEDQRYDFTYYFKKGKKIRVDFSRPYSGLTLLYQGGDENVTVIPLRFLPLMRFSLSINNPVVQTPAGQRINQTDIGHFIDFLSQNLERVPQEEDEFQDHEDQIKFLFRAMDYIEGKSLEKYRISISKKYWLPVRIERYDLTGQPIEVSIIQNYVFNRHLPEDLFEP